MAGLLCGLPVPHFQTLPTTMYRALVLAALVGTAPIGAAEDQRGSTTARVTQPAYEDSTAVEIKTKDKLKVHGSYFEPRKKSKLAPAALLIHDTGADRYQLMDLGQRLHQNGFAVLVLDLRCHGKSVTPELCWKSMDASQRERAWALAVRDVDAAAQWLLDREEVHSTNLNLVGFRSGSALAARHALRDENVRSVALVEPQAKEFGIDVAGDLQELGGLPTYIVSLKAERKATEAMIQEAHQAAGGHPYIELMVSSAKPKPETVVTPDRKVCSSVSRWMKEKAFPQEVGRGAASARRP